MNAGKINFAIKACAGQRAQLGEMIDLIPNTAGNKSKRLSKMNICYTQYLCGDASDVNARNPGSIAALRSRLNISK